MRDGPWWTSANEPDVIRDPPPYRDILLLIAAVGLLWLINPHDLTVRERGLVLGPTLGVLVLAQESR